MFCMDQSIVASSQFGQVAAPVKCKRWGCENCAEWRQRCLMAHAMEGQPNRMITLTCRRDEYPDPISTAKAMVNAWRTIVLRWRRLQKWHQCEYFVVFEPHKSGWPHMHILWKGHWIEQEWLSKQGSELLNSPNQSVSVIRDGRSAAAYVAKYFSKEPTKYGTLKRYWTSKGWPKPKHIDATPAFHKGFPIDLVNKRIEQIKETWVHYKRVVWERAPNVIGWGCLYNPGVGKEEVKKPPWNHAFGFQEAKTRRNPAPMARGRGQRV